MLSAMNFEYRVQNSLVWGFLSGQTQIILIIRHLESLPETRYRGYHSFSFYFSSGTPIFIFSQRVVGYSGRVDWCLVSCNTTIYSTGKEKGPSHSHSDRCQPLTDRKPPVTHVVLRVRDYRMTIIQAQFYGMGRRQGVLFRDLLVVKKEQGSMYAFFQDRLQMYSSFGSRDMPFSVRRGSYRSIILEKNSIAAAERQTLLKNREENRLGLQGAICRGGMTPSLAPRMLVITEDA